MNILLFCAGDFNTVLGSLDYQGGRTIHSNVRSADALTTLMEEFNLCDIWRNFHPNLKQYSRHQKSPRVLSRLDFILVSKNFVGNCTQSKIIPGIQSDHSVVTLHFKDSCPKRGTGFWKLNCQYLHHDSSFLQLIKERIEEFKIVHSDSDCNPNTLWDALKCSITGTCIEYCSRKKKEKDITKKLLLRDIEEVDKQICDDLDNEELLIEKDTLIQALNDILNKETQGLMVRSRIRWAEEGEKSSRYFCNLEKRMGEKKSIFKLKDDKNAFILKLEKIMEEIYSFYKALYAKENDVGLHSVMDKFLDGIEIPQLSDIDKLFLETPISKQELYDTLISMKHNKSPGLDGLPVEFYIVFWKDLCDMLLNSYNFSLQNGFMSLSQRNGVITLIPKKDKDLLYLKNFRPITLLTVDYKILAKMLANRLKKTLSYLIHPDQSGFLKGRNIGNNVRLIIDIIEYTKYKNIPGAILLLDIQKAFDSVSHEFLIRVLKKFNFSNKFIDWIKVFYSGRKSYVLNYGNMTNPIDMERGIFQGCPISPYLFLLVIEIMALAIRQNCQIKGIPVENQQLKINLLADDSTCFIDGSDASFKSLFNTIDKFSECSGCKLNVAKSEAIWIGSRQGCQSHPFADIGLKWNKSTFKTLGIHFSLNINQLYNLNHKIKLKSIENTLNCWRVRNLSLVGKICVIKTLLLPQLLYYFSVLCIHIPKIFFKQLNSLLFHFIWNGNDRVKRQYLCNDISMGGLKMVDPYIFSVAQKMSWVKLLLDPNFNSLWKLIEISALNKFSSKDDILWKTYAPSNVVSKLLLCQLAESLQTWYVFREKAVQNEFNEPFSSIGACQCIWYNKNICSKSKHFFLYQDWLDRGIVYVKDLLNPPHPDSKLFEELVLDFNISNRDRRKYNFLMKNIPDQWLIPSDLSPDIIFNEIRSKLVLTKKIPKYAYKIMLDASTPERQVSFWNDLHDVDQLNWEAIHVNNFKCTIITRIRSFYFKLFHRAIGLNDFLFKIKRKESPNCSFCNSAPENYVHLFIDCSVVKSIWDNTIDVIKQKIMRPLNITTFQKLFGCDQDKFLTFLFLLLKYYIYLCKFQNNTPTFIGYKAFVVTNKEIEYNIARKNNKLSVHFKKWRFML